MFFCFAITIIQRNSCKVNHAPYRVIKQRKRVLVPNVAVAKNKAVIFFSLSKNENTKKKFSLWCKQKTTAKNIGRGGAVYCLLNTELLARTSAYQGNNKIVRN